MPRQSKTTIPLVCNLCTKSPQFSDISHLLTHIASKSHLSNRFKLQIKSQGEPEARAQLEHFDNWYAEYGIEDLLSDRMALKEQKKSSKRPKPSSGAAKTKDFKQEVLPNHSYSPMEPKLHTWSTGPISAPHGSPHSYSTWNDNSAYTTPTMRRQIPNFPIIQQPEQEDEELQPASPVKLVELVEEKESDATRLKGILWPGMALFDSATSEMKRKRNQRKDGSVLARMKSNSAEVMPNEWIFNAHGDLERVRHIYDDVTPENSPIKSDSDTVHSPKKRRMRRSGAPLGDISTNAPRLLRIGHKPAVSNLNGAQRPMDVHTRHPSRQKDLLSNPLGGLSNDYYAPDLDEDEDFRMTVQEVGRKQKLIIFRDTEEQSPGRTESPLQEHRFDFHHGLPESNDNASDFCLSTAPVFKPSPIRFAGKENSQLHNLSRSNLASNGYPPQAFQNDLSNPLFYRSHSQMFPYGEYPRYPGEFKPLPPSFYGEFTPVMTDAAFHGVSGAQGFTNMTEGMEEHEVENDARYGSM